jgi:hypothetical protein
MDIEIETLNTDTVPDSEIVHARHHTMLWNEKHCLDIAPGQRSSPLNIICDAYAEELSPSIYYGVGRQSKDSVSVTPYMMATNETKRSDRRGVAPQHILYTAMKTLRLRVN